MTKKEDSAAPTQPHRRRVGHSVVVVLVILATFAWYGWTAATSAEEFPRIRPLGYPETDHFNLLSHGFRQGHLHLEGEPPSALTKLANPYDPTQRNGIEVLHDASYFRGKYYIYFGPAPVVTLLLPFSIVTGHDLPLAWAVWIFCCIGYAALAVALLCLQRRHFPAASAWTIGAALLALAGGSMLVSLLRRSNVWELSAASGFCFFALSLLCLVRGLHSRRAAIWTLLGGLALGLAVASRPTYIVCSVMFVAPLVTRWRRKRETLAGRSEDAPAPENNYGWRDLVGAAAGCSVIVATLLLYNAARFANPLEFGQKYQLSAIVEGDARHFGLGYAWFNLRVYFFSILRWLPTFPFHHGIAVPPEPAGFGGYEYAFGLFPNLPFSLLSIASFAWLLGWRRPGEVETSRLAATLAIAIAAITQSALLLCYFGTCIRYMVDFAPAFLLLAALGLFDIETRLRGRAAHLAWRGAAVALAVLTALAAAMSVAVLYSPLPKRYLPVARAFNYPYFRLQAHALPTPRPVEITFSLPAERPRRTENLVTLLRGGRAVAAVTMEYLDESRVRFAYHEHGHEHAPLPPAIAVPIPAGIPQVLRLRVGGPFAEFDGEHSRLRGQLNGQPLWDAAVVSLDAFPAKLRLVTAAEFSGKLHAAHAIGESTFAASTLGGARIRINLTPALAGRAFPLATAGRSGAGDLLFMRVQAGGGLVFGYDHWGDALLLSPEIRLAADESHVVEFWMPAVAGEIVVRVDGRLAWRRAAPAYPATPVTFFVGTNPIGGTTCEPVLQNAVIEAQQLPPPLF